jgi:hypothetical protein
MSKTASRPTPKKSLKATMILYFAIVIGIFIFLLVAILVGEMRGPLIPDLNKQHTTVAVVMAIVSFICLFAARQLITKDMEAAKNSLNPLSDKLDRHRMALIKYLIICEVPVFLSIIIFLLTGNYIFQVYAGVFIGFMLTLIPTAKKVGQQLGLSSQEQQMLK